MTNKFKYFQKGIELRGETSDPGDAIEGSVWHNKTTFRLKTYIEAAVRTILTDSQAQTVTNKTINGPDNTVTNIGSASLASGIDATKIADGSVTNAEFQYINSLTSDAQTQINGKQSTLVNSAGLAAALSDETGTGLVVFNNSPSLLTPSIDIDVRTNQASTPSTPGAGISKVYTKTDNLLYILDSTGTEIQVGAGSSSLNTSFQLRADDGVTGWTTGDNAVFLGGGTLSGTFVRNSTTPLHGNYDFKYTQAAGSLDDYLASPIQNIDPKFRGNIAYFSFTYKYDGANSDILAIIYDVTNSTILSSTTDFISLNSANASMFISSAVIPASCTQLRVGFHVKSLNSGKIFQFDDVQLGQDLFAPVNVNNMTEWASYTPTFTGFGTATNIAAYWRQDGSDLLVRAYWSSGTHTATEARVSLPSGLTSSSAIATLEAAGQVYYSYDFGNSPEVYVEASKTYMVFGALSSSTVGLTKRNGNDFTSSRNFSVNIRVPIQGWASTNPSVLVPNQQYSTDTASFVYASSATYTLSTLANAPIGTFLTFTRSASTNTRIQTTTAPTQTTASMNTDGIRVFGRAFSSADSAGSPGCFAIQIGKGLKGIVNVGYESTGKVNSLQLDKTILNSNADEYGLDQMYDEVRGILFLDAGRCSAAGITGRAFMSPADAGTNNVAASAYIVTNAGKTPAVTAMPNLSPRIATLSDVKSNGTNGGSSSATTTSTRTLNTLSDPTNIVSSLSSNQFTLSSGSYKVKASSPAYKVSSHQARLRNITTSTTVASGTSEYVDAAVSAQSRSFIETYFTITSANTYELQHYTQGATATNGLGVAASSGESETYAIVEVIKIK